MSTKNHPRRRLKLWQEQNGLCYWCRQPTVITKNGQKKGMYPLNMATIDHLRSRLHPDRREPARGQQRLVMACLACNQGRGHQEVAALPIEDLRARCQAGHESRYQARL